MSVRETQRQRADRLASELAQSNAARAALEAWLHCLDRQDPEWVLDVPERALSIAVRGAYRAHGGVARVRVSGTSLTPDFLTSIVSEWLHDSDPFIRSAARALMAYSERQVAESVGDKGVW